MRVAERCRGIWGSPRARSESSRSCRRGRSPSLRAGPARGSRRNRRARACRSNPRDAADGEAQAADETLARLVGPAGGAAGPRSCGSSSTSRRRRGRRAAATACCATSPGTRRALTTRRTPARELYATALKGARAPRLAVTSRVAETAADALAAATFERAAALVGAGGASGTSAPHTPCHHPARFARPRRRGFGGTVSARGGAASCTAPATTRRVNRCLRDAVAADARHLPSVMALRRSAARRRSLAETVEACAFEASVLRGDEARVRSLLRAAELARHDDTRPSEVSGVVEGGEGVEGPRSLRHMRALGLFRQALEVEPGNEAAFRACARCSRRTARTPCWPRRWRRASPSRGTRRDHGAAAGTRGASGRPAGRPARRERELETILQKEPQHARALARLSISSRGRGVARRPASCSCGAPSSSARPISCARSCCASAASRHVPDAKRSNTCCLPLLARLVLLAERRYENGMSAVIETEILVVDDDTDIRGLVCTLLERAGMRTIQAADGEEGLKKFFEHRPALVVLDVTMPNMDGFQALSRIRSMSDVPVLMLARKGAEVEGARPALAAQQPRRAGSGAKSWSRGSRRCCDVAPKMKPTRPRCSPTPSSRSTSRSRR